MKCPYPGHPGSTHEAHAARMDPTRGSAPTDVLDRASTSAIADGKAPGTIVRFPLTSAVPGAEDVRMRDETDGSAALRSRSWAGLGAITVMILTVVAYATVFGLIAVAAALRGVASGDIDLTRAVLAAALLAPAGAILLHVRRHRS
jgi:hypothetical protein